MKRGRKGSKISKNGWRHLWTKHVRLRRICNKTEDVSWTKERLRHYFHNCYKRTKAFFFIFNAAWLFLMHLAYENFFSFLGKIKSILYFWKYTHHRNLVDLVYQNAYTKMSIMHYKKEELNPFFFLHKNVRISFALKIAIG